MMNPKNGLVQSEILFSIFEQESFTNLPGKSLSWRRSSKRVADLPARREMGSDSKLDMDWFLSLVFAFLYPEWNENFSRVLAKSTSAKWGKISDRFRFLQDLSQEQEDNFLRAIGFVRDDGTVDDENAFYWIEEMYRAIRGVEFDTRGHPAGPIQQGRILNLVELIVEVVRPEDQVPGALIEFDHVCLDHTREYRINHFKKMLIEDVGVTWPPPSLMPELERRLDLLVAGGSVTFMQIWCPDYAFDPQTGEFTFEGINDGVGLLGSTYLRANLLIWQHLKGKGLEKNVKFVIVMPDVEASYFITQHRYGLSFDEFCAKMRKSMDAVLAELPSDMRPHVDTVFLTDLLNRQTWEKMMQNAWTKYKQGSFDGPGKPSDDEIMETFQQRIPLYQRWLGDLYTSERAYQMFLHQIIEHIVAGAFISGSEYPNQILLDLNEFMSPWYQGMVQGALPVIVLHKQPYGSWRHIA